MLYLYDFLKIFHIILASIFCTTIVYDVYFWLKKPVESILKLQKHALYIIIPLGLMQLLMGFTMISIKHLDFHQKWILVSIFGFPILIASWLLFVYFSTYSLRTKSRFMLGIAIFTLLMMIFFMANKIT